MYKAILKASNFQPPIICFLILLFILIMLIYIYRCLCPLFASIWAHTQPKATQGLSYFPHMTPGWVDVFGPSFWVYVFRT